MDVRCPREDKYPPIYRKGLNPGSGQDGEGSGMGRYLSFFITAITKVNLLAGVRTEADSAQGMLGTETGKEGTLGERLRSSWYLP